MDGDDASGGLSICLGDAPGFPVSSFDSYVLLLICGSVDWWGLLQIQSLEVIDFELALRSGSSDPSPVRRLSSDCFWPKADVCSSVLSRLALGTRKAPFAHRGLGGSYSYTGGHR